MGGGVHTHSHCNSRRGCQPACMHPSPACHELDSARLQLLSSRWVVLCHLFVVHSRGIVPCCATPGYRSDYPLDSLDVPAAPEQQRLNSWQETHARLMLQRVQQLQDLRFVLCPK